MTRLDAVRRTGGSRLQRYGPWALVTGATSGIGRQIAVRLAAEGFDLVLVARTQQALTEQADALRAEHKVEVRVLALDLASSDGVAHMIRATADLDIGLYAASAGFGSSGGFLAGDIEQEREMLRLNCEAVLVSTHALGQRMVARGRGGIILFGSIVGFQGTPNTAHYAATKAYVQNLAEALYVELRPLGVDVLASAPGPTASGFAERAALAPGRTMSADTVARSTLAALGRRPTALPGALTRVLRAAVAPLPRRARVRIMGTVMAGMVET